MQTPLGLDIKLQSYDQFIIVENNTIQRNLNSLFANISKSISVTSDSFPLIMSHIPCPAHIMTVMFAYLPKCTACYFKLIVNA